jgi:hypothetical protein
MDKWLKYLVGISAIIIAGCAAYFSITGLGILFAGASVSVMIMAGSLEYAKLVTATYLKQKWDTIKGFNKWYLTISVIILMLITSAGIFGFLSNAFQQQNIGLQKVERDISVYQNQITKNDGEITRYTTQLNNQQNIRNSQESNLSKQIDKDKSTARVTQMIRSADKEISSISKRIDELTRQNNVALDSINTIKNNNIELEREVGGFRFVAEAFGMSLNNVVKFFIFLIVIVFDPLAIALVIAFNQLVMTKKEEEELPPSNPEDLKNFVDETARLHLSENDLKKLEETLLNPPKPNEELKKAEEEYKRRGELLAEIMKNDEEMGLYDEPFDNPMIKEDLDDEVSDWDETLMDGLEDEPSFFTEEETEKILQEELTPTTNNKLSTTIEQHKKNGYKVSQIPEDEERMNIIGQNGNEGLHYDNEEDTSLEKNDEKKN